MSQITHFCSVKFLAGKSGYVKFLTNIMSALRKMLSICILMCYIVAIGVSVSVESSQFSIVAV